MLKTVTELRFLLRATKGAKNEKRQQPNGAIRHGWITLVANNPCSKFVFFKLMFMMQSKPAYISIKFL